MALLLPFGVSADGVGECCDAAGCENAASSRDPRPTGFGIAVPRTKAGAGDRSKLTLFYHMQVGIVGQLKDAAAATVQVARVLETSRNASSRRRAWPAPSSSISDGSDSARLPQT